jgi:hypothetical protein
MEVEDDKYKPGQIWTYDTRDGEEESRVMILRTEKWGEELVVHLTVMNARIKNKNNAAGYTSEIGHLPFSKEAMERCLSTLESSDNTLPDYMGGYNNWREAYESEQGGIFTITVKEAIDYVEKSAN